MAVLLLAGCKSLAERTYVTKVPEVDERPRQQAASSYGGIAGLLGQLAAYCVNGATTTRSPD